MKITYFLGMDGNIYTSEDIDKAVFIVHGISKEHFNLLKHEISISGIARPLDENNIEDLVIMGRDNIAMKKYYESNNNITLKDAAEHIHAIKMKYNKST